MTTLVLDGNTFSTLAGFYEAMEALLSPPMATGHNLDSLNDLLRGGFGITKYGEPFTLRWQHFAKSREDLGDETTLNILQVMMLEGYGHDVKVVLD